MSDSPMSNLVQAIQQHGLVRFVDHLASKSEGCHLKDLVVDAVDAERGMIVNGRRVINFGSDSFLGLDHDPRVQAAIINGVKRWGTHNGASRAFSCVRACEEAEQKLAAWLGVEAALIYPSVTLANLGAIPGLVGKRDLLVVDEHSHNSIQEAAKIAKANGVSVRTFNHCDPEDLCRAFHEAGDYRNAVVAIDGVYSMTGALPPLLKLNEACLENNAVLYVDDAHGTGVLGKQGTGTVLDSLGSYDNVLVVGSLSKAFSCAGGFIGCPRPLQRLLKIRSNTFIFGGPVAPAYLEAIGVVCDILSSTEGALLQARLRSNLRCLTSGLERLGLVVLGGQTPIVSILVGDEDCTLQAGHLLFEAGYYVQSVTFPAVPYHAGLLRVQVNANHRPEALEGLLKALADLKERLALPEARDATNIAWAA